MAAYYIESVENFLKDNTDNIIGTLTRKGGEAGFFQQMHSQTRTWGEQIDLLKNVLLEVISTTDSARDWGILLEYEIVRRAKRIDVVIIADCLIVIEFKGSTQDERQYEKVYKKQHEVQLLDYCQDLKDFHFESRYLKIFPILLVSKGRKIQNQDDVTNDDISTIQYASEANLAEILLSLPVSGEILDYHKWNKSIYSPTPTIIEAARVMFAGQDVTEILQSHSGKKNLTVTTDAVLEAINEAQENNRKIICFITGVPGAGKTLAGLKIAYHNLFQNQNGSIATFLSGNGPLIKVLRSALSRDAQIRLKKADEGLKSNEKERITAFIENIHHFVKGNLDNEDIPPKNKIVIFDEAQRAWDAKQSKRKFGRDFSEPEMLLEIMKRHEDWAVIIALVGGGQEINTGEVGLPEWGRILSEKYRDWKIYISNELKEGDHSTGNLTLFEQTPEGLDIVENSDLHLNVSIRAYKAEKLSEWVSLVLDNKPDEAKSILKEHLQDYRLAITRDLEKAKGWLRKRCRGTRRMGIVASSGARRLRPHGVEVRLDLEVENWFLNPRDDIRSSYFLEIPATEYKIQGLELDWVGLCWDIDLRRKDGAWESKFFSGKNWQEVKKPEERKYILNSYRVLLTRGREGMVIWIPEGGKTDVTRPPDAYDAIYNYLKSCGIESF